MAKKIKIYDSARGYDLVSEVYDQKEKHLNSFEKSRFLPMIENWRGKKVLDVGAGTGRVAIILQKIGAEVTALDISPKILKVLQKKEPRIKTVVADGEDLPFE
ncbi:MAG: methyltransferase domain-containing protein, partial [Patescibacteria group bacterium]